MDARRFAMNYGAILGLVCVAILFIIWLINANQNLIWLNHGLTIAFIYYAVVQYRDINNNGFISYGASLKLGTTVAFFSSIILAFYEVIFLGYIDPDQVNERLKAVEQVHLMMDPDISEEELNDLLKNQASLMKPHWLMVTGMLAGTFAGFFYSLFISIFVKKEDPNLIA